MAVTARPKIAKSENAVPPWFICPFAATPVRGQSTPNSLERVHTGPGLKSLCRSSPWLAGRDHGPWLELSAMFGNLRPCSIIAALSADPLPVDRRHPFPVHRLLRRVFPIGSDVITEVFPVSRLVMGSGVRSAHVKSRTSVVENRQSAWNLWNFWPLATDPLGKSIRADVDREQCMRPMVRPTRLIRVHKKLLACYTNLACN